MTSAIAISLKVLVIDIPLLLIIGTFLGWTLAKCDIPKKELISTVLMLPVALPPAVLGLYLLLFMGRIPAIRNMGILFSFSAAAIAALIPSLPIMISAARSGFSSVPSSLEDAARTMGKGELETFFRITFPLAKKHILAGLALSSARALGDFGVTLMIAGNIPGRTQTLPLYIYSQVEALEFQKANAAAIVLTLIGVGSLYFVRKMEE